MKMKMIDTFKELSKRIWEEINLASKFNLNYGEETITDLALLDLARKHSNIHIIQTGKKLESEQGCDWEWYIGSNKYGWLRFIFQAKKLKTSKYVSINHKVWEDPKAKVSFKYQSELLRKYADANNAIPLYCFYNYYPKATESKHWHCKKIKFEDKLLGWTFTPLKNIEKSFGIRNGYSFDKIHLFKETLSIPCLFNRYVTTSQIETEDTTLASPYSIESSFLGEHFTIIPELPASFLSAIANRTLIDELPDSLYNRAIGLYPKRIAVINVIEDDLSSN